MEKEEKANSSLQAKMNIDSAKYMRDNADVKIEELLNRQRGWNNEWKAMSTQVGDETGPSGKPRELGSHFLCQTYEQEEKFRKDLEASQPQQQKSLLDLGIPINEEGLDRATCIWAYTRASPTIFSHLNDVLYNQEKKK